MLRRAQPERRFVNRTNSRRDFSDRHKDRQACLGPSIAVMPAPGKPFDLFVGEEALCRRYAEQQVAISPQH